MSTTEHLTNRTVEALATNYGPKVALVGGASAVLGGLSLTDLLAIGGFTLALVGTVATVFFGWRKDRRETAEAAGRRELLLLQKRELLEDVDRRKGLPDTREFKVERRAART